jgi:hypothetical protein
LSFGDWPKPAPFKKANNLRNGIVGVLFGTPERERERERERKPRVKTRRRSEVNITMDFSRKRMPDVDLIDLAQ